MKKRSASEVLLAPLVIVLKLIGCAAFFLMLLVPAGAQAAVPAALAPRLSRDTRLLIFSPHPDDESLGAGGLMQRVLKAGGRVQVVFMTNGDGFPEGVEEEDHISHPTAKDYRRYGAERRVEALKAARRLGLSRHDVIFLGFPDGGIASLRCSFLTGPRAYRSPFTPENCPPASEVIIPRTDYTGQDLTREIERLISRFQPNLIATTPPQDEHPDHSATYFFVNQALIDLHKKDHHLNPRMLGFLIHFGQWPLAQGAGTGSRLNPPTGLPSPEKNWVSLALTPEEAITKRQAILEYHSQMLVMGRYLLSIARSNELFMVEN